MRSYFKRFWTLYWFCFSAFLHWTTWLVPRCLELVPFSGHLLFLLYFCKAFVIYMLYQKHKKYCFYHRENNTTTHLWKVKPGICDTWKIHLSQLLFMLTQHFSSDWNRYILDWLNKSQALNVSQRLKIRVMEKGFPTSKAMSFLVMITLLLLLF